MYVCLKAKSSPYFRVTFISCTQKTPTQSGPVGGPLPSSSSFTMWKGCLDWHHCSSVGQESRKSGRVLSSEVLFCSTKVSHCIEPDLVARSWAAYVSLIALCGMYSLEEKNVFSSKSCLCLTSPIFVTRFTDLSLCESSYLGVVQ